MLIWLILNSVNVFLLKYSLKSADDKRATGEDALVSMKAYLVRLDKKLINLSYWNTSDALIGNRKLKSIEFIDIASILCLWA
jgi:hypothetical protein